MADVTSTVIERLIASKLLTEQQIATCQQPGYPPLDDDTLLQRLVEQDLLTHWQATQLKSGKGPKFFLGQYKLMRLLGIGGMGHVFEALDMQLNRTVAVKVVSGNKMSKSQNARFRAEAKAALQLQHTNIVRTYELGQQGSQY